MSKTKHKKKRHNKKNKAIIAAVVALFIVIIALLVVVVCLLSKNNGGSNDNADNASNARAVASGDARVVLDSESTEDIMQEMREEVAEGMFECQMSMTWSYENGGQSSEDAYVANSVNNTHPLYFDVYLEDTEELLYASPVLPVGSDIIVSSLDKDLEPGEYEATVMYHLVDDAENQNEISSAGFIITLNILN